MSVSATIAGGTVTAECTAAAACSGTPVTTLRVVSGDTFATGVDSASGSITLPLGQYIIRRETTWPDPDTCPTLIEDLIIRIVPLETYTAAPPRIPDIPDTGFVGILSDEGRARFRRP
jgi:hypothetical protein